MTCPTNSEKNRLDQARAFAAMSDCDRLALAELALNELRTGKVKTQVRYADYWVEYAASSIPSLEREVTRLRRLCNPGSHHAITIGRSGGLCR